MVPKNNIFGIVKKKCAFFKHSGTRHPERLKNLCAWKQKRKAIQAKKQDLMAVYRKNDPEDEKTIKTAHSQNNGPDRPRKHTVTRR